MAVIVDENIERLCVGAELDALQVAPLVAHGAEGALRAVLHHLDGGGQRRLVVHVERDEDIIIIDERADLGVCPYGQFHLAAIDASVAGEVQHHGLALLAGISHAGVIIRELGMHLVGIEVEVLRLEGRRKGADGLQRGAPQAGHHIDGKGQRSQGQEETGHADLGVVVIVRELELAQQVEAQQAEEHDPQGEERLAVQYVPAISQVGHREEFQRKSQFDEAQHHLDDVHPAARPGHGLQPRGEEGEEREGQGQRQGEAEHADGWAHDAARGGHFDQQEADDGARAGEAHQRQREGHQEDADEARRLLGLAVHGIAPLRRERNLERAEERGRKDHQQEAEEDVEHGVGGQGIQRAGAEQGRDDQSQSHVDDDDGRPVGAGIADALLLVLRALQEEADRHRDDGPHAGGEQGQQAAQEAHAEDVEPREVARGDGLAKGVQFVDDGRPIAGLPGGALRDIGRPPAEFCAVLRQGRARLSPVAEAEGHLRGRQAILVVAGAVLQVAFHPAGAARQLQLLHELRRLLEIAHLHLEQGVEAGHFLAHGLEFAHGFGALHLRHVEGGRDGAPVAQVCRIDVPARVDGGRKHDFRFLVRHLLPLGLESDRVQYLRLHQEGGEEQEERE